MSHIHSEDRDGFKIDFYALAEHITLEQLGYEAEDAEETRAQLEDGALVMFCAKITASKNGIELASDYLGGCIYKDEKDFINNDCYYGDMVRTVIAEAKQAIIDLNKGMNNDN